MLERHIEQVGFHKKRAMKAKDMTPSSRQYGQRKRFYAGVEAGIYFLKRCFGSGRCLWHDLPRFPARSSGVFIGRTLLVCARNPWLMPVAGI